MINIIEASFNITFKDPLGCEFFLLRHRKICSRASLVLRCLLNPKDLRSDIVSAMGSRANAYKDCIALSYIVGIPKGRFFFLPGLLMKTLLRGFALYLLPVRLRTAFILESGVNHFSPSIPGVLFPLL